MWNKKHVHRVPEDYAQKFPEDLGDCLICKKTRSGIYLGMVVVSNTDERLPGWAQGFVDNAMLSFSLCDACYNLPDVETRVEQELAVTA
jgi:hypothetical protein